ncbi:ABC transporter substrate-binding protein [Kineococcus gynurae]|uniref:ABC transporter substrate-binding protein n=1 Tax=Kineococcus gynurae TaxID=452979 RepID=A0ABV5LXW3_9ACTN
MSRTRTTAVATVLAAVMTVPACANIGLQPAPEAPPGFIGELRMPSEAGGSVQGLENYNWLSPNASVQTWLFEPLMIRDRFTCEAVPMLATGYDWTSTSRLVLHLREGVRWNDGEPFTADDVAFSMNAAREYPGMDRSGLWSDLFGAPATAVTATDDRTVVVDFAGNATAKTDSILDLRPLPEHVYASVGDPTRYVDTEGVATGPFMPDAYNGRRVTLQRNPDYWQADKVKVQRLVLEGQFDANSGALRLRSGALDLYSGDIPNPERSIVAPDPEHNHYFFPPDSTTVLAMNTEKPVLDDPRFREAIAHGIDREGLALRSSFGIMEPASQTMLLLPFQAADVPERWRGKEYVGYEPRRAEQLLDAAGYPRGADGWRTGPDGAPLDLVLSIPAGWMDFIAMGDVLVRNLRAVGVQARMVATDPNAVESMKKSGDFDLALDFVAGGCQRSRDLGATLSSAQISSGDELLLNRARFSDPEVDALLAEWSATLDPARAKEIEGQVIDVFMTEYPYIALQYAPSRLIYRTENAVGWPSEENPYPVDKLIRLATRWQPPAGADATRALGEEN